METDPNTEKLIEEQKNANQEALKGSSMADLVNPASPVYQAPAQAPREKTPVPEKPQFDADGFPIIPTLRTYQADISNAVSRDNISLTDMAVAEQNKRAKDPETTTSTTTAQIHLAVGIVSALLFITGVGAVAWSFFHKTPAPVTEQAPTTLIPSEEHINLDITAGTKRQISAQILSEAAKVPADQTVRNVIPVIRKDDGTYAKASLSQFLDAFQTRMPDNLLRTLDQVNYMVAIDFSGKGEPFIILNAGSYDIAYAGLLDWEGLMKDDMQPLFAPQLTGTNGYNFTDRTILNHDTRSLEDSKGNIAFFYSLIDNHYIVIAKSALSFKDILDRIREAKLQ